MGEVWLAQDTYLKRKIALKLLPEAYTRDPERVRRFEEEAQAASALNHPSILTIYEMGQVDGAYYFTAEFVEGETLRRRLQSARLSLPESLEIAIQIASALTQAHEAGIAHRDIKPENLMIRPDGLVKVLDFGLAKLTHRDALQAGPAGQTLTMRSTTLGSVVGTASYMSPEQARGLLVEPYGHFQSWRRAV